jgi:hypothetical protein
MVGIAQDVAPSSVKHCVLQASGLTARPPRGPLYIKEIKRNKKMKNNDL